MSADEKKQRPSVLARAEDLLYKIYGPAQLGGDGSQPDEPESPLAGVQGDFEIQRDSAGHAYLVRRSRE